MRFAFIFTVRCLTKYKSTIQIPSFARMRRYDLETPLIPPLPFASSSQLYY
jgi:hypothetical protein